MVHSLGAGQRLGKPSGFAFCTRSRQEQLGGRRAGTWKPRDCGAIGLAEATVANIYESGQRSRLHGVLPGCVSFAAFPPAANTASWEAPGQWRELPIGRHCVFSAVVDIPGLGFVGQLIRCRLTSDLFFAV